MPRNAPFIDASTMPQTRTRTVVKVQSCWEQKSSLVMALLDVPGGRLNFRLTGSGAPVLFIQGVGLAGSGWRPQVDELSREFRCLSFDNRGIGESTSVTPDLTIEQMADDARRLLDFAGWESAHVVGHSMGGLIGQQLALETPERVRSLSLLCTFSRGTEAARITPWAIWMGLRTRLGTRAMRRQAFLEMLFPREYLADQSAAELSERVAADIGRDLADPPAVWMSQLNAMRRYDRSQQLGDLGHIPTLIAGGAEDPIAPSHYGRRLHALIPHSRYMELARLSHGMTLQAPSYINWVLRNHFQEADAVGRWAGEGHA